jgi:hypothetical protein
MLYLTAEFNCFKILRELLHETLSNSVVLGNIDK